MWSKNGVQSMQIKTFILMTKLQISISFANVKVSVTSFDHEKDTIDSQ
jgi:hypothetical protein